jgi:GTPase SAR1 family protein
MFSFYHSKKEERKSFPRVLCEDILTGVVNAVNEEFPAVNLDKDKLIENATQELAQVVHDNIDTKQIFQYCIGGIRSTLENMKPEIPDRENEFEKIDGQIKKMEILIQSSENVINSIRENRKLVFEDKIRIIKEYQNLVENTKKKINILSLGPTQSGKTALIKRLFNIDFIKLKGGTSSDTDDINVYQEIINNVLLTYTDTPGFFDSRNKENENMEKICNNIHTSTTDIIFWVSKMGHVPDINQKNLLKMLTSKFGKNIWKKTIVILTHANTKAPIEYYCDETGKLDENISKIDAWKKYVNAFRLQWKQIFMELTNIPDIPVVLMENNIMAAKKIDDVYTLYDGTPIIETLMFEIFKVISIDKAPILFLPLAGDLENIINNDGPREEISEPDSIEMKKVPQKTEKVQKHNIILTEHQKALDCASDKTIFQKNSFFEKILSKCTLF